MFSELKAVLVKGRQNYLSLRRMDHASAHQQSMLSDDDTQQKAMREIATWSRETNIGDKADLGYDPHPAVWRQVMSDRNNCLGRRCPRYQECFFYKARKEIEEANILIVNHHLYFSDLALREDQGAILPPHRVVIFDEAHTLEDVATEHLGVSITEAQIRFYQMAYGAAKPRAC